MSFRAARSASSELGEEEEGEEGRMGKRASVHVHTTKRYLHYV